MRSTKWLIIVAVTFCMATGFLTASQAKGIPDELVPALIQAMKDEIPARYHMKPSAQGSLIAENPAQKLSFGFANRGIEVIAGEEGCWRMQLISYSIDGRTIVLKPVTPEATGAQVEYAHKGMTEWYINSPYGMEQGFTFQAPEGLEGKKLTLTFRLEGEVVQQRDSLVFRTEGRQRILYKGLQAFDAADRSLNCDLSLRDNQLTIDVDIKDVAYPVTVDPLFSNEIKLTASDSAESDSFGYSVAISGDTAIIGAAGDDDYGSSSGSAYVFVRSGNAWSEQQKLTASDGATGDAFGVSATINGDTAVIGAYGDDDNGSYSGSAYVFVRSGNAWSEQQKLTASDGAADDYFGISVAISGDTVVIGANGDDENGSRSGSGYVFVRSGSTWSEQQKLTASDGAADDRFGNSVGISGDTIVIGAYQTDSIGIDAGSAYVFIRSGNTWFQQQKLAASDGAADDRFGNSVAISGDTIIVGAYSNDGIDTDAGSAYVFVIGGATWTEQQKLTASDGAADDRFGISVAISGDTAVIGAYGDDDNGTFSGSTYVFVRSNNTWFERQKHTASDGAVGDWFGHDVAICGDIMVVGAQWHDDIGTDSGSAYVFVRVGNIWLEEQKNTASDGAAYDFFGNSVAISGDTAVIGAYRDDGNGLSFGSAYVFVRNGNTWSEQQELVASDGFVDDFFGYSVAISGDTAIIGAIYDDDNGSLSGSAYVFVRNGNTWSEQQKLTASDGDANDYFGYSVAISEDTAIIGAIYDDDNGTDSGSAYVFVRSGNTWFEQQKLTALDGSAYDCFGGSVAIGGDTAIIGADSDDENGTDSGSAYVFVRSGNTWFVLQKLTASDSAANDWFGYSVAISGDTAIIGAPINDDSGTDSGSAYAFVRSGITWSEQQKLTASDNTAYDFFGISVAISGDTAIIGAIFDDDNGTDSGSAFAFARSGGTWHEQQKLTASDGAADDRFGGSVAISGDTAVIGADRDDDSGTDSGSAYIYQRPTNDAIFDFGSGTGLWGRYNNTTWSKLHNLNPEIVASGDLDGSGQDDCIIDFGSGIGIYILYNNTTWAKLHSGSAEIITTGDLDGNGQDDCIIDFGPSTGLWVRYNNATWTKLHNLSPEIIVTGDLDGNGEDDCVIDFGAGIGVYVFCNNSTWTKLHSLSPEIMAIGDLDGSGQDDCIMDFGSGVGTYVRYNNANWTKLHNLSPETIATGDLDGNGQDECIIDFGAGTGLWVRYNNSTWTKLHNLSPEIMATGDLDGSGQDEVIIDFSSGIGVYVYYNNATWTKIHNLSPESITTGNLDNN